MYFRYSRLSRALPEQTQAVIQAFRRRLSSTSASGSTHPTAADSPTEQPKSVAARISKGYERFHNRRPHTTQVLQAIVVSFVGDTLSQAFTTDEDYDLTRTSKVMLTGSILSIPTYRWFVFMARNINHANKYISLAMKCVANQTCFAPFFLSSFLTIGFLWQGITDPNKIFENLKQRVPVAWVNGCMYWPNVVILNFTLIPPHCRGLVNSAASVIWQAYLSWLTFSSKSTVDTAIAQEINFEHKVSHKVSESLHLEEAKSAVLSAEQKAIETEQKVVDFVKKASS
ncbi:uncharacterized protein V1516DRAFT_673879 [Lipomyces oligophaga]|uniref:uncharacterized protein n=1 Tax=Lipomyces oligophaga TaxID=45792 RepID=UPI0034CE7CFF